MTTKTTETGETLGQVEAPVLSDPVREAQEELERRQGHMDKRHIAVVEAEREYFRGALMVEEMRNEVYRRQLVESDELNSELTDRVAELEASNGQLQENIDKQVADLENDLDVSYKANMKLRTEIERLNQGIEHYKQSRTDLLNSVLQYLYTESERQQAKGYADGAFALAEAKKVLKDRYGSLLVRDQNGPAVTPEDN